MEGLFNIYLSTPMLRSKTETLFRMTPMMSSTYECFRKDFGYLMSLYDQYIITKIS